MDKGFWENKKVLVTGHSGFVGAWICAVLDCFGMDSYGFSLTEENGSIYGKIKSSLSTKCYYGDLRNYEDIAGCINSVKPDVVFHIAAFGFVKECFDDPNRAYSSNVQGTLNLFQALRETDFTGRIIVASSDKVYKNSGKEAYLFTEEDPLGGSDPYSSSKTCEDILAQSFFDTYLSNDKCSLCVVRPSNILGGGDHNMNRLIPSIYYNLSNNKKPEIRNPDSVRPWQNIFDIVDAYLTVAERVERGCVIYNVGPEEEGIKTVGEIAEYVSSLYGVQTISNDTELNRDSIEKGYLGLSINKIKRELGWRPKRTLEQTLKEIYDFYSKDDGKNTYDICMSQIKQYYEEEGEV